MAGRWIVFLLFHNLYRFFSKQIFKQSQSPTLHSVSPCSETRVNARARAGTFFLRMIFAIFQLFFKLISFTNVRCYHSTVFWTTFTMFQLSFFLGMIFVTFQLPFKLVFYERSYERSSLLISLLLSSVDLFYPFCRHFKLVYLQRFSLSFYLSIEIVLIEQRPAVII